MIILPAVSEAKSQGEVPAVVDCRESGSNAGVAESDVAYIIATGYGRFLAYKAACEARSSD